MEFIEVLLGAFGGATVALAVVAYLGRRFLDIQVSRATEKYKAELEQKSAILKTELSIYAHEQNVGISRLDQQRSDAIRTIFGLVTKWHDKFLQITISEEPNLSLEYQAKRYSALSKTLISAAEDITIALWNNAIFFQHSSYEVIGGFGIAAMELSCAFYDNTFGKTDYPNDDSIKELLNLIAGKKGDGFIFLF